MIVQHMNHAEQSKIRAINGAVALGRLGLRPIRWGVPGGGLDLPNESRTGGFSASRTLGSGGLGSLQ